MTRKLYYEDSYLSHFEGSVLSCTKVSDGYEVVLDKTAFYPGGGGQPMDYGEINGLFVSKVEEREDIIYHVVKEELEVSKQVVGDIYIEKRLDYMAQHTGEHIIAGIINKWFGFNNVGFHLNERIMTADFDGELTKEELDLLEIKANDIVFKDLEVTAKTYSKDENIPEFRAKMEFPDKVRIISVDTCDTCACCGTHVSRTGEVGVIKIVNSEKHRGGCRLTILCGRRALYDYQARFHEIEEVGTLLSAPIGKISDKLQKHIERAKNIEYQFTEFKKKTFETEIKNIIQDKPVSIVKNDLSVDDFKVYGECLSDFEGPIVIAILQEDVRFRYKIISKTMDVRLFANVLKEKFDAKGGGKKNNAQGSGVGRADDVSELFYQFYNNAEN
ncbi:MAG: alanyl-tRNA editing protein [Cellulosilyticaceae bacterium]